MRSPPPDPRPRRPRPGPRAPDAGHARDSFTFSDVSFKTKSRFVAIYRNCKGCEKSKESRKNLQSGGRDLCVFCLALARARHQASSKSHRSRLTGLSNPRAVHRSLQSAMMQLLAVLLACSSAVATTPPSNPARRPAPMLHRARQLSVDVARKAQDVVGHCVNPQAQEPASVSVTEAAVTFAIAFAVQVLVQNAVFSSLAPRVADFIGKTWNICAMSRGTFAIIFGSINGFFAGLAGGIAGPTTFLLCILFLRVFVHSRPLMTAKSGHLGPPPSNSFGRLRGGDCTKGNEAWLHITKTVRMLTDGCLFVAVGYLLHKVSFGHAGIFWTCWFLLFFHPTLDGLLRKIRPGYDGKCEI